MKIVKKGINLNPKLEDIKLKRFFSYEFHKYLCRFKIVHKDILSYKVIDNTDFKAVKFSVECPSCKKIIDFYDVKYIDLGTKRID